MPPFRVVRTVAWLPWGTAAFARARDEGKRVLLAIAAPWSAACRVMDERCYSDAEIVAEINRSFIPVRVDADRRPDIAERYELGGLPTTAFLNADGDILGGGTFVPPERFLEVLTRARQPIPLEFQSTPGAVAAGREHEVLNAPPDLAATLSDEDLAAVVFSSFDEAHGGFGSAPKFPLVAPIRLALDIYRETTSSEMLEYVARSLDAMAWNGLYDDEEGGFCRCCAHADWSDPQREKLLGVNAALVSLYVEAGTALGNQRWLARAGDALDFVQRALSLAPDDGWRASLASDNARLSDANAAMVSAALRASTAFEDGKLRETALRALESVLLATYKPGHGIAHWGGGVRGLLSDHVAMITAHLDAFEITGDEVYQMMAQELAQFMARIMTLPGGGFADRAAMEGEELSGLLARPLRPFVLNCDAAYALVRMSRASHDTQWLDHASRALASVEASAPLHGPLAAHFLLARRSLAR